MYSLDILWLNREKLDADQRYSTKDVITFTIEIAKRVNALRVVSNPNKPR